jgi:hypothetical protein
MEQEYHCEKCNYKTKVVCNWTRHCQSVRHIKKQAKITYHECKYCAFITPHVGYVEKHLKTLGHKKAVERWKLLSENPTVIERTAPVKQIEPMQEALPAPQEVQVEADLILGT